MKEIEIKTMTIEEIEEAKRLVMLLCLKDTN